MDYFLYFFKHPHSSAILPLFFNPRIPPPCGNHKWMTPYLKTFITRDGLVRNIRKNQEEERAPFFRYRRVCKLLSHMEIGNLL